MQQKSHGIVLHALKYGDNSLIVKIFTRDFGLKTFMVRGFRGKKSAFSASLFLPLTLIRLDMDSKKTSSAFNTLKDAQCYEPMHSLQTDIGKQAITLFIAEILYKTIVDDEPHADLFEFIEHVLKYINSESTVPAVFPHFFLVNYSRFLGLYPNEYSDESTTYFNLRDGVFGRDKNLHSDFMSEEESEALKLILRADDNSLKDVKISKTQRNNLLVGLLNYYKIHLLNFREIKSHNILAEVMRG